MTRRRAATFQDIYERHIRAGDDPAYALYAAEEWQKRQRVAAWKKLKREDKQASEQPKP